MKRLESTGLETVTFPGVRFDRNDIEHLIDLLERGKVKATLSDGRYEYDSLDEMLEKVGTRPRVLNIKTPRPDGQPLWRTSLSFSRNSVTLSGERDVPGFLEVKELLNKQRKWYSRILNPIIWLWAVALAFQVTSAYLIQMPEGKKFSSLAPWVPYALGSIIAISLLSFLHRRYNYGVFLTRKHEGGFLKRNGDKIVLLVLGGILGVLGKFALDLLTRVQTPPHP